MFCVLVFCAAGPLLVNNILIDWGFMPDQAKYFKQTESLRDLKFSPTASTSVMIPSIFFSLVPVPFIETINSIGFINKLCLGVLTILLFKFKKIDKIYFYFLNLCPSVYLYASLSLKDTLSLLLSLIIAVNIIHHRGYILNILTICLLSSVKMINGFLFVIIFYFYNLFFIRKALIVNCLFLVSICIFIYLNSDTLLFEFNRYRTNFYIEANLTGNPPKIEININSIFIIFKNTLNFIVSPLYNLDSSFKLIQVIENMILYIFTAILFLKVYSYKKKIAIFWFLAFLFSLMFYGVLIFNDGTIARYRYVLLIFFNFIFYLEFKNAKKN